MMFKRVVSSVGLLLLVLSIGVVGWLAWPYLSLEMVQCHARDLLAFAQAHYYATVVTYLCIGIFAISLFLPIVTVYMITAGFLFGPWEGALYAIIGVTIGAVCAFLLVRATVGQWVEAYERRLVTINGFVKQYGFYALMFLRMSHLVPFFLLNIAAGLMPISLYTFMGSTFLGVIPGALLFAWTGQYLCSIQSVWDLLQSKTVVIGVGIAAALLCIVALGVFVMRKQHKQYEH